MAAHMATLPHQDSHQDCGEGKRDHFQQRLLGYSLPVYLSLNLLPRVKPTVLNMSERLSQISGHLSNSYGSGLLAGEVAIITGK